MDGNRLLSHLKQQPVSRHTVDVGLRIEAVIVAELTRRGIAVLQPCSFNHRYDLVLDLQGQFVRAQCKTGRLRDGVVRFNTVSTRCNARRAIRRDYRDDVDVFLVHCPDTGGTYAVPVEEAAAGVASLRVRPTDNGQASGVRWARDYELPA